MRMRSLVVLAVILASMTAERAFAEAWVAKMFSDQAHDFGTVARGADTVHRFAAKNIFKQDVELVDVRSSCGCTSVKVERKVLKTGEIGYVTATFNTRTFTGLHGATLTVEVIWHDNGVRRRGETQLRVNGNIRGDVVFKPGAVKFDDVDQGKVSERSVEVSYEGRSAWKVLDVRGVSEDLEVELTQKRRTGGRVAYDLLVRLKDSASAGYFNEQLVLVTNDEQYPRIPIHIAGRVVPEISVAPEPLLLGEVEQGGQVSKKVRVSGKKPFRIVSMQCDDQDCFQFKTGDAPSERHIVEIIFDAKKEIGSIRETIRFTTDLGETYQATLTAFATVVPAAVEPAPSEPNTTAIQIEAGTASAAGTAGANVATQ